jgi:hypothetical protein
VWLVFEVALEQMGRLLHLRLTEASRPRDFAIVLLGSLLWLVTVKLVLEKCGSALPRVILRRLSLS